MGSCTHVSRGVGEIRFTRSVRLHFLYPVWKDPRYLGTVFFRRILLKAGSRPKSLAIGFDGGASKALPVISRWKVLLRVCCSTWSRIHPVFSGSGTGSIESPQAVLHGESPPWDAIPGAAIILGFFLMFQWWLTNRFLKWEAKRRARRLVSSILSSVEARYLKHRESAVESVTTALRKCIDRYQRALNTLGRNDDL